MEIQCILSLGLFSGGVWQIVGQSSLFGSIILIILVCFSLISWAIMFNKWRLFKRVDQQSKLFLTSFRRSSKFTDVFSQANTFKLTPYSGLFLAGYNEIRDIINQNNETGTASGNTRRLLKEEIEIVGMTLERATAEEVGRLEKYVVFLATTANTSPFLGLLGTVVGVMDAFWSIGERGSASLAVVAPGIAEALLATIVGLGAAIPAVIGFNWANNKLKYISDLSNNFSLEFLARLKRDNYR
jgi:biopolymer transport protein TolQ